MLKGWVNFQREKWVSFQREFTPTGVRITGFFVSKRNILYIYTTPHTPPVIGNEGWHKGVYVYTNDGSFLGLTDCRWEDSKGNLIKIDNMAKNKVVISKYRFPKDGKVKVSSAIAKIAMHSIPQEGYDYLHRPVWILAGMDSSDNLYITNGFSLRKLDLDLNLTSEISIRYNLLKKYNITMNEVSILVSSDGNIYLYGGGKLLKTEMK